MNRKNKKNNQSKDKYYIHIASSLSEGRIYSLKDGDLFAVFNQDGFIRPFGIESHGIFFEGTRFLSRLVLRIENKDPMLLSSGIKDKNDVFVVDFTNPELGQDEQYIPKESIHLLSICFLKGHSYFEKFTVVNYGVSPATFTFSLEFEADFKDIFEVRGLQRKKRGYFIEPLVKQNSVKLGYRGLDTVERKTLLSFSPRPSELTENKVTFQVHLKPHQEQNFFFTVSCQVDHQPMIFLPYEKALKGILTSYRHNENQCSIETSNEQFNEWIKGSTADLFMVLTETDYGFYPYAGIPWYNTVFGRDGLITAMETLWLYPQIARGVLRYVSAHQATHYDPEKDAEPGKILHEVRKGEMANLKEIPFKEYYGSIDSTLLFLIMAGYYYKRTGDRDLLKDLWPSLLAALEWTYKYGDRDGDGFIEYQRKSPYGLRHQGWKDSEDSVFHDDGSLAEPPIALCEVQAYLYEAKMQMSILAREMGNSQLHQRLLQEAEELKNNFLKRFWCKSTTMLALALDGKKTPCCVVSSNAGQSLFSGIVPSDIALKIRDRLFEESTFSGWGIRTIATTESRYNPMSYHNGSVWPHDNALIAYGLSRYGFKGAVLKIIESLFEASIFMDAHCLPELFCGFERRAGKGPTKYPVACDPQAWSSAAVFMLLQSCLGLTISAQEGTLYFVNPVLPAYLEEVRIRNLEIGKNKIDLDLQYHPGSVGIKIVKKTGNIRVVSIK